MLHAETLAPLLPTFSAAYKCSCCLSLQMVGRSGKLTYRWEGTAHLPRLLALLYSDAVASEFPLQSSHAAYLKQQLYSDGTIGTNGILLCSSLQLSASASQSFQSSQ